MMEDCIFCKLANGIFETNTVYEDEDFRAIMDISPAAKGHVIVLAKRHAANIFELPDEYVQRGFLVAKKIAQAVKKTVNCDGINTLQNNGEAAGQTIFHFHIHVIPRYDEDNVTIKWENKSFENEELKAVAKEIANNL